MRGWPGGVVPHRTGGGDVAGEDKREKDVLPGDKGVGGNGVCGVLGFEEWEEREQGEDGGVDPFWNVKFLKSSSASLSETMLSLDRMTTPSYVL